LQPLPRSVRIASLLLSVCAALAAMDALSSVLALLHLNDATPAFINARLESGSDQGDVTSTVRSAFTYNIVVGVVAALA
jgi:hypothetical protein